MKWILSIVTLALPACGSINYEEISAKSQFEGRLFVMWVGEGSAFSGDGRFVFVPHPSDPLTLTRVDSTGNAIGPPIRPEIMYTDGGSIPRIATVFKGFSPWGYAPAYMIHDWLFIAHHCNIDGTPTDHERQFVNLTFKESAVVIAESIKALQVAGQVASNDVAGRAISSAVSGPISLSLWHRKGACSGHRVSESDRLAALRAFPASARGTVEDVGLSADALGEGAAFDLIEPAQLIGEFGF